MHFKFKWTLHLNLLQNDYIIRLFLLHKFVRYKNYSPKHFQLVLFDGIFGNLKKICNFFLVFKKILFKYSKKIFIELKI